MSGKTVYSRKSPLIVGLGGTGKEYFTPNSVLMGDGSGPIIERTLEQLVSDLGITAEGLPPGIVTGDFMRWNAVTEAWEVVSEPLSLTEITLIPAASPALEIEGSIYYKSTDKSLYVCTDV